MISLAFENGTAIMIPTIYQDRIPGGLADERTPEDFDPEALAKGIKVEMEHTDDPVLAREIAMDHLTEDKEYYDKLAKMEKYGGLKISELV